MATYRITAPDGRTVKLTGESPPTEAELEEIFAKLPPAPQGLHAAAAGAETIGEAPWYSRNYLGLPSVTQAMRALPAVGGFVGGAIGAGVGTAVEPGGGTVLGGIKGAALGGAAGESARQLMSRAIGGRAPATSTEAALGIGKEALIQGGAQAVGVGIGKGLAGGGSRVMQSALKPNPSLLKEYGTTAPKLVKTLLDEGVNVTPGGMEKLQRLFQATNAEIKEAVKNAPGEIERDLVAARVLPTARRLSQQVNPSKALKDVRKTVADFLKTPGTKKVPGLPRGPITIPEAQAMKVGTYKQIGKDYGKLSSAAVETQKALARGLKEEIEAAIPKIKALNAREGELMAAQEAVGHRVAIAGNRDPVGFAWVTSAPQTFLAALMDRSHVVKSMLARGMYSSAGAAAKVSPQLIRAAVVALASDESASLPAQE